MTETSKTPPKELPTIDDTVFIFKCIVNFIHDLSEIYGDEQKSLQLYDVLMDKTGIVHQEPIKKHIKIFHEFLQMNEDAILDKDESKMEKWELRYSDKVYINMKEIFECTEEKDILWQHLLTLLAVLIPTSKAKAILQEEKKKKQSLEKKEGTNEEDFLTNVINKVQKQIDPSKASNPAEMMNGIFSSGIFTELVNDMNDGFTSGDLDMTKMMGSFQNVMGNMSSLINNINKPPEVD